MLNQKSVLFFGGIGLCLALSAAVSGCTWDSEAMNHLGPVCENADFGRCTTSQICDNGECKEAGAFCRGARRGADFYPDNGYEYCLTSEFICHEDLMCGSGAIIECNSNEDCINSGIVGNDGVSPICVSVEGYPRPICSCSYCAASSASCKQDSDCGVGSVCSSGSCVCNLNDGNSVQCPGKENTCCPATGCANLKESMLNCGACNNACLSGQACADGECITSCSSEQVNCNEVCVDPKTNRQHCGVGEGCTGGTVCDEGKVCSEGKCQTSCDKTQVICEVEGVPTCVDLKTSNANCGACGNACPSGEVCSDSRCAPSCQAGLELCDGVCVSLGNTNRLSCYECIPGYGNCDNNWSNGCEVNLNTDNANCGGCGSTGAQYVCASGQVCTEGTCANSCLKGQTECSNTCVDLNSNASHCGECSKNCRTSEICSEGSCRCPLDSETFCDENGSCVNLSSTHRTECTTCVNTANSKWGNCNESGNNWSDGCETNLLTDSNNCGRCGNRCTGGEVCNNGECSTTCGSGLTHCVKEDRGYCTNLQTDSDNCGSCTEVCRTNDATIGTCSKGSCVYSCAEGYSNCGTAKEPDCIVVTGQTANDVNNCGACGNRCVDLPNVLSAHCTEGGCVVDDCDPGYADCNGDARDGCEVNLRTDSHNCNACGSACQGGEMCSEGRCGATCGGGLVACPADKPTYCANTSTDPSNCNGCGRSCTTTDKHATAFCNNGTCNFICQTGYTNCGTADAPNCIKVSGAGANDANNCGFCGHKCSALPNVDSASCKAGVCEISSCKAGFSNCNSDSVDGCETNTKTSINYCGATGGSCLGGEDCSKVGKVCDNGTCSASCAGSLTLCGSGSLAYCADFKSDVTDCGGCGKACAAKSNAVAACNGAGSCTYTCESGYTNCGTGNTADKIDCRDLSTAQNCGACGHVCATGLVCTNGQCVCPGAGDTNCSTGSSALCLNLNATSGNMNHCGACNFNCGSVLPENAKRVSCTSGVCYYTCESGYINCGSGTTGSTIKCINPLSNSDYCGLPTQTCNELKRCDNGMLCSNGQCVVEECSAGLTKCAIDLFNYICVDPSTDIEHCGCASDSVGLNCNLYKPANGYSICSKGVCKTECNAGYTWNGARCCEIKSGQTLLVDSSQTCHYNCGYGKITCEVSGQIVCLTNDDIKTSNVHCGGCNNACTGSNRSCQDKVCKCNPNYLDNGNVCCQKFGHAFVIADESSTCSYVCESGYTNNGTSTEPRCE